MNALVFRFPFPAFRSLCPPETGWTRSEATEGVDSFPLSTFRLSTPLRSLSRVASDYSSESVVCFGTLRTLRPLREIKNKILFFLHAEHAKSAEIYFVLHAGAGEVANFVTTCHFLSTPSPLRGTTPVSGVESRCLR